MKDQHTVGIIATFHPKVRDQFTSFVDDAETKLGIVLRCAQGFRTFHEQQVLYNLGRDASGNVIDEAKVVTKSPPGASYHNYGLAGDFVPLKHDYSGGVYMDWKYDFSKLAKIANTHGISWGGDFTSIKDLDHFENRCGYNWRDLLHLYQLKRFIPGTTYVKI